MSGISKSKVANLKIPGFFLKKYSYCYILVASYLIPDSLWRRTKATMLEDIKILNSSEDIKIYFFSSI